MPTIQANQKILWSAYLALCEAEMLTGPINPRKNTTRTSLRDLIGVFVLSLKQFPLIDALALIRSAAFGISSLPEKKLSMTTCAIMI